MATKIKANTTFRNEKHLSNGIVREGQTDTVADHYAEEISDKGLASIVDSEVEGGGSSDPEGWSRDLPEDTPKRSVLLGAEIHTMDDLRVATENEELKRIDGIGPAYQDRIESFVEDFDHDS